MVIRTGTDEKGKWITEERNVLEDYKKLFGREPPNPVAFGFLIDGDDTKGKSWGDYDHFKVQPKLSELVQVSAALAPVVANSDVKKEEPKKAPVAAPVKK